MKCKRCGTATLVPENPPEIYSWAAAVGKKEGKGPLRQ